MKVAVVRTGAGNLFSLGVALERIGVHSRIVDTPAQLRDAERVILPGVGEARSAMDFLAGRGLDTALKRLTVPVLGICLGTQLLCRQSEERHTAGLGVFDLPVTRFRGRGKVPHVGWNRVEDLRGQLFSGIAAGEWFYFVHAYRVDVSDWTAATCDYLGPFSAALERNNFFGVQFHPEKSGAAGRRVLENFCCMNGGSHAER